MGLKIESTVELTYLKYQLTYFKYQMWICTWCIIFVISYFGLPEMYSDLPLFVYFLRGLIWFVSVIGIVYNSYKLDKLKELIEIVKY